MKMRHDTRHIAKPPFGPCAAVQGVKAQLPNPNEILEESERIGDA